tara:strand:- start:13 stop:714 length:702 start_codon:yes stop_codon:yes gene_type:complete
MVPAIIGGAFSVAAGLFGSSAAKRRAAEQKRERDRLKNKLNNLENSRQKIINPYEGITNLSELATNLSSQMSNPFANLSVATGAAEMKIEEADLALANTLDTIRATGGGAGGATALAQAALKSKKGVAASIEMQEKQNEDKRAAGEQQLQDKQLAEERRMQGIAMSEGQRMQQADVAGKQFVFSQTENRQMQELDRTASLLGAANQAYAQSQSDQTGAMTGMLGSLAGIAGGL